MKDFLLKNSLYLITAVGVVFGLYTWLNWADMALNQRLVGLFTMALSCHIWEEMRFPGGFVELVTKNMHVRIENLGVAKLILLGVILYCTVIPMLLPDIMWLTGSLIMLGFLESAAHLAATRLNDKCRFYSPGLLTALTLMLPLSIYGVSHIEMSGLSWLWAAVYMFAPLLIAQRVIIKMNGMPYGVFVKNAFTALFGRKQS